MVNMTGKAYNMYNCDGNPRSFGYYIQRGDIDIFVDDDGNYCIKTTENNRIVMKMDKDGNITIRVGDNNRAYDYWGMAMVRTFIESTFNVEMWGGWEYRKRRIWIFPRRCYGWNFEQRFAGGARMFIVDAEAIRFDKDLNPLFGMTEITKADWDAKMEKKKNAKHRLPKTSRW